MTGAGKRRYPWKEEEEEDWHLATKQQHTGECDGALLCLPPQALTNDMTAVEVGSELARCLHEHKKMLCINIVEVLGLDRSLEFFTRVSEIQKNGGILANEGNKKKSPGGVFFALVKKGVSDEERKSIFARDKKISELQRSRRKIARKREEILRRKAQRELERFRSELDAGHIFKSSSLKDGNSTGHYHQDRNMEKRYKTKKKEDVDSVYVDLDNPSEELEDSNGCHHGSDDDGEYLSKLRALRRLRKQEQREIAKLKDEVEEMEVEILTEGNIMREEFLAHACLEGEKKMEESDLREKSRAVDRECAEKKQRDVERENRENVVSNPGGKMGQCAHEISFEERLAAEQFENADDCDLDFGIDLSSNF